MSERRGHTGFNDEVWLDRPDQFLHGHHVLRILNDGAALPAKLGIFWHHRNQHEFGCIA